ncbi:hypothetical protein NH340_JMT08544 [Sarcoptes scabiei]|nr:hypothetical protein NH340_JMT08544 [Sarcoptes scabiei]
MQPPRQSTKRGLLIESNSGITDQQLNELIHQTEQITDHYDLDKDYFARGKFAHVRRIKHKKTGLHYAAKTIKKRRLRVGDVTDEIKHEIRVLISSENCPYIVKLQEVYETKTDFTLVLELAEGGELQQILDEHDTIDEYQCQKLIREIIVGIDFLHRKRIAHLDIKNDFEIREIMGTTDYMPPEILQYDPITTAADMWSIGIVTYVLLSGHSPFGDDDKVQTYSNITSRF